MLFPISCFHILSLVLCPFNVGILILKNSLKKEPRDHFKKPETTLRDFKQKESIKEINSIDNGTPKKSAGEPRD